MAWLHITVQKKVLNYEHFLYLICFVSVCYEFTTILCILLIVYEIITLARLLYLENGLYFKYRLT